MKDEEEIRLVRHGLTSSHARSLAPELGQGKTGRRGRETGDRLCVHPLLLFYSTAGPIFSIYFPLFAHFIFLSGSSFFSTTGGKSISCSIHEHEKNEGLIICSPLWKQEKETSRHQRDICKRGSRHRRTGGRVGAFDHHSHQQHRQMDGRLTLRVCVCVGVGERDGYEGVDRMRLRASFGTNNFFLSAAVVLLMAGTLHSKWTHG